MTILDICDQDRVTSNMRELWAAILEDKNHDKLPMFLDACIEAGFANLSKNMKAFHLEKVDLEKVHLEKVDLEKELHYKSNEIVFANDNTYIAFDFNGNFNVIFDNKISWVCVQGERFYTLNNNSKWEKKDSLNFDSLSRKQVPLWWLVQELYQMEIE